LATSLLFPAALNVLMKGRSIVEASLVFAVLQLVLLFPEGVRNLVRWENNTLGGSYLTGALMIALGVFVIIIRRYEFRLMGLATEDWKKSINYGIKGYLYFLIPQVILSFFLAWGVRYQDFVAISAVLGGLVLSVSYFMVRKGDVSAASNRRLVIAATLLVSPLVFSFFVGELSMRLLKEFAWNILVGGFAEEFFYRGYIQSSVNQEYGKEWKIGKTSFGPGLMVSAALYGLGRGLRTVRPWSGVYSISWSWTLYAFTVGIFYGLIRESSGDIIASGTANSMIDAIGEAVKRAFF
jgi:membrane protease YdiL (CAAX protease family)